MAEAIDPKYIFDPENPRSSPTYKLLLKIIKDGNHLAFMDPYFFGEIYHDEIFDTEVENEIWDKSEDYDALSGIEKTQVFIENYSLQDYSSLLIRKKHRFNKNVFSLIFPKVCVAKSSSGPSIKVTTADTLDWDDAHLRGLMLPMQLDYRINSVLPIMDSNYLFFLTGSDEEAYWKSMICIVEKRKIVSVICLSIRDYEKYAKLIGLFPHLKPIILQRPQDIHILFEALMLDIYRQKGASNLVHSQEIYNADSFIIQNYFSIHAAHIAHLGTRQEIYFLGENGDGKTILLQSMILALKGKQQDGFVVELLKENPHGEPECEATDAQGGAYRFDEETARKPHNIVLGYGSGRFRNDAGLANESGYESLFDHKHESFLHSPEQWLKDLRLNELSENGTHPAITSETAIHLLEELLGNNVKIEIIGSEVSFIERGTRLKFKQLSDGYKSVLVWLCDMLARLTKAQPEATQLQGLCGIVLVDEIGLYLHPKWQYRLVGQLRSWFPKVQFIFTTHSPMILLGASRDAVFYRVYKEDGVTKVSAPVEMASIANQMANSLITAPFLFGLESARPAAFDETIEHLETADSYISGAIDKEIAQRIRTGNKSPEEINAEITAALDAWEQEQKKGIAQ